MFFFLLKNILYFDVAEFNQLGFQDGSSLSSINLVYFHDHIMFFMIIILILVGWLLFTSMTNKYYNKYLNENSIIEIIWTTIPALILILIAIPSLYLLYSIDENIDPSLTIKVIGHQWYWSYEYSNFDNEIEFDSYMIPTSDLNIGGFRLLEVDNKIVLPVDTNIRLIISSADVIHCWTIPSLGVKADAIPGRLNQVNFIINRSGKFFGQCSEICGSNHSFMPISILSVSKEKFINWSSSFE
uniref:Cytochrome c oxidase subunit 2 n=1 Tax=Euphysa aurata TaxID=576745 RepID=A0A0S2IB94_9CNID|nr:cytochrome c oxidase subunit 2 [Euphysa aurata]